MKTGLESLDTGAPEITYSGNQGPKSPQEDQRMMQEFEMQQMAGGENDRVRELLLKEETKGLSEDEKEELRQLIKTISAGMEGGIGDMAMKSGLIDEYRNYKMGQEEAGEQFMSPRDYYRSLEQDRMGAAGGGIMRTGFRGGGMDASTTSFSQSFDRAHGTNTAANANRAMDRQQAQGQAQADATNARIAEIDKKKKEARDKGGFRTTGSQVYSPPTFAQNFGNKLYQSSLNRNKVLAIRKMGLMKKGLPGMYGAIISGVTGKVPKNLEDLTEKELTELAFEVQKFTDAGGPINQATYNYNLNPTEKGSGSELLGRVFEGQDLLDKGLLDQTKYEELFPGNIPPFDGRDGPPIILPPVMPMGGGADLDPEELGTDFTFQFGQPNRSLTEADQARISNIGGKSIFLADGGMAREPAAFGGIMGDDGRRAYGLGSMFKKAIRGIKKVAKSPLGKAALMYFGGNYLQRNPLMGNPFGASNPFKGRITDFLMSSGKLDALKNYEGFGSSIKDKLLLSKDSGYTNFDPFKLGIAGLSALTYLKGKQDEDDEPSLDEYMKTASRGPSLNPSNIREYIAANKSRVDPNQYAFLQPNFYAADGGRIDYANGGIGELRGALSKEMFGYDDDEDDVKKLAMGGSTGLPPVTMQLEGTDSMSFPDDESTGMPQATPTATLPNQMPRPRPMMDSRMMQQMMMAQKGNPMMGGRMMAAMGGRMGFADGGADYSFGFKPGKEFQLNVNSMGKGTIKEIINSGELTSEDLKAAMDALRNRKAEGGMMDMGGLEKDYRNDGGFVPIGGQERADDVPARLSKNEFVFTADAVRNAGGGDIDKGAEIMENMMENLEAGGKVSQGSQGLSGAREMFATQQRLGEVL